MFDGVNFTWLQGSGADGSPAILRPQPTQACNGFVERRIPFAEGKSHLVGAVRRIAVETRPWYRRYANRLHQMASKFNIAAQTEPADISHDVIGAARRE